MPDIIATPAWTSFEAEAFRVSVWRCDDMTPRELARGAFPGWQFYPPHRSMADRRPNLQMYGGRTVCACGNPHGVDAYLVHDSNIFNERSGLGLDVREKMLRAFHAYAESSYAEDARPNVPFNYRITADSHNIIPLRGGLERYGNRFRLFADARSRRYRFDLRRKDHEKFAQQLREAVTREPFERFLSGDKFNICKLTDEVHVHGPIPRAAVGSRVGAGRVELVSAEWLDLAIHDAVRL